MTWIRPGHGFGPNWGAVSLRTGHLAISLGLGDALLDGVNAGVLKAEANALNQWRFRVARLHGETNPYRHLLPEGFLSKPWTPSRKARPWDFQSVFS